MEARRPGPSGRERWAEGSRLGAARPGVTRQDDPIWGPFS